uniref:NADH dehydrogenase subunit 2 n=1 Tax=Eucosmetus incisus TaxID=2676338 RepID=UPI002E79D5B7|nr:NADH dehydrogenase subunit 2 [Eucosmetus incisus]WQH58274.1 NADH dehydrogenase subunit 2 [Eucosmetus incisus]
MMYMYMLMLMLSTLIVISSNNWMSMWIGLEMNLMFFIPLLYEYNNKKSSQSMMIYFLIQSISSLIFLFSIMMSPMIKINFMMNNEISNLLINMSILMKLGSPPFHNWLPEMMNNLNWNKMLLLMTWQKLAPMFVLSNMKLTWLIYMSITLCVIIGAIGGINTTSLRKIMAYSSINHMGWMMAMMSNQSTWYSYWIIYSIMVILMVLFFNSYNSYTINQLNNKLPTMMEKYIYSSLMLSMGGLPPFMGFLTKWMVIQSMINYKLMLMIMLMMSMITLFYYMRMISSFMLMYSLNNKWFVMYNNNMGYFFINLMLPMMLIFNFF